MVACLVWLTIQSIERIDPRRRCWQDYVCVYGYGYDFTVSAIASKLIDGYGYGSDIMGEIGSSAWSLFAGSMRKD